MSACRIRSIFVIFFFAMMLDTGQAMASDDPISPFLVKDASGEHDSANLLTGRRVVFTTLGKPCRDIGPFIAFREKLPVKQRDQVLILCVGKDVQTTNPYIGIASHDAIKALGITGTPMILGIEENRVKWRIAGRIPQWQVLAEQWIMNNE
jgi:hypothetical protein